MTNFNDSTFTKTSLVSPITIHAEFKGGIEKGYFEYYDKELTQDKELDVKEFIILKTGYKISGYVESLRTGAWSNEVSKLDEDIIVQTKQGILVRGQYKDIKEKVKSMGLNLYTVLTVLQDGEVYSLSVRGFSSYNVNKIIKASKNEDGTWNQPVDWRKYKIKFAGKEEQKKGAVKFNVALFEQGSEIESNENLEASMSAELVNKYYENRHSEQKDMKETPGLQEVDMTEDLPFN